MSVIENTSTFGSECTFLLEDLTGKIPFAPSGNGGGDARALFICTGTV